MSHIQQVACLGDHKYGLCAIPDAGGGYLGDTADGVPVTGLLSCQGKREQCRYNALYCLRTGTCV